MNRLIRAIERTLLHFEKQRVPFALVGGLAVSARTEPRFTRDADFAVAVSSDHEAEATVRHFLSAKYRILSTIEQDARHRLATVRLSLAEEGASGVVVDLLFASSGIEQEIVEEADALEVFDRIILPVGTVGHLLALKVLSHDDISRPQDLADIHQLIQAADRAELTRARGAVALITERGYHRDRDLIVDLERIIRSRQGV